MSSKVDVALVLKSWDATGQKGKQEQGGAADLPALWTSSGQIACDVELPARSASPIYPFAYQMFNYQPGGFQVGIPG
jgi:hypothetical protein